MYVVFIHGPAAAGKHTVGARLSELTGLPLFHNHLAVDAALALFDFGSPGFRNMRAGIWRASFLEAAAANRSFIFTFQPEATVEPGLVADLTHIVEATGGRVFFVELTCSRETTLSRLQESSRAKFRKLTDPQIYQAIEAQGGFKFPALPSAVLTIDTDQVSPDDAARRIAAAIPG